MVHMKIRLFALSFFSILLPLLMSVTICKAETQIAITVDDLPSPGSLPDGVSPMDIAQKILATFKKHHISDVYGFVNASSIQKNGSSEQVLARWVDAGHLLGNHTFSHMPLYKNTASDYIADIQRNEPVLSKWMGKKDFYWFRFPYLAEGDSQEKRTEIRTFLETHHYKIAQVSTDFSDWKWQDPYIRCLKKKDDASVRKLKEIYISTALSTLHSDEQYAIQVFKRPIKHLLLVHFSAFTAVVLDDLLSAYKSKNVNFISLKDAASDLVYKINPNKIGQYSGTFLFQVGDTKGLQYPDIPVVDLNGFCSK
jgi:peptidoglycan/xylan/chitin deacetylase (PgdA/CDA1 family)